MADAQEILAGAVDTSSDPWTMRTSGTSSTLSLAGDGVKTVAVAGTDEALAGSTSCSLVTIQAQTDNTGLIAVGATGVDATEATGTGLILYAGDSVDVQESDLANIYIDATVSGDGVRYTYYT